MERWKELPPITLDNTTVSYLVTLIPVLVSMTSKNEMPQEPQFENEKDKPEWWPSDVQWRNPKCFMHEHLEKEERLMILRKLVHSCYSYHGVADLLCRLDEMPSPEPAEEGLEVIELTEEDRQDNSSANCDGPVFVCCFCLDQFTSHEEVNNHQSACKNGLKEPELISPNSVKVGNMGQQSCVKPAATTSFLEQDEPSDSRASEASEFLDAILCSGVSAAPLSPVKCAPDQSKSRPCQSVPVSISAATPQPVSQPVVPAKPARKPPPAPSNPYPFVPTLKTRSQKKLDQIMLKHSMKKMMLKECEEMRAVPKQGAWWRSRKSRPTGPTQHPSACTSQLDFCAGLGLARTKDIKREVKRDKEQQEVDLDCQIVLVEGPLSIETGPQAESNSPQHAATSPRSSRSLMSQLCRDSDESGRRRLSFRFLEDEWADKEALEEGRDPQQMSLLSIEFSSPLGVRIRKYMSGEGQLNIVKDPEVHCKTEDVDDSYSKLRVRANEFRVTFRKKRRASRFVHKYKFNKKDRHEFKRLLQTGLTARSRKLQRQLNNCFVSLKRVPVAEIKEWTEGKKIIISEQIVVDEDICITQVDIPESQMKKALSQEKNLAFRYKPGPKCFAGQGRRYSPTTINRPTMGTCGVPSPPHVPNIFRNRNSHAPSPPRLGGFNQTASVSHINGHSSPGSRGQQPSSSHGRYAGTPRFQQNRSDTTGQSHLSQHRSLAPSVHERVQGVQQGEQNSNNSIQVFTGHNSPNRRKQQLTHVRRDEVDLPSRLLQSHDNPFSGRPASVNLMSHQGMFSNQSNHQMKNSSPSSSTVAMLGRKLSNFDHFSIKNGKLALPLSPQRQQQSQSSGSNSLLPTQQPQSGHRSRPLPDWGNPGQTVRNRAGRNRPNQASSLLPLPSAVRSVSVIQRLQNRSQQVQPSPTLRKPSPQQPRVLAKCPVDEDIMEVICIDDD
ncbi:hypothetical protein RRG08_065595 [Elysia crispata]|uniref:Nuclear respiratory factor 1 NLS/DNA-binding dimerisation domain-containing protein n=1 Tax=Elysia crispata TaxID=231223 RepID=A0AAE0YN90_9GAST|nr:hypothetical protein RRG08_065595 [Elysia crispata]